MNKDTLQLIGQIILIGFGPVLAKHGVSLGNNDLDEMLGGLSTLGGIVWKFWHWNATPSAPAAAVPINRIVSVLALTAALFGCARLQPGADPLVVRVEQTESIAKDTFDMVLGIDNSQRDFYRSNAPGFHNFCEWLRQPQTVEGTNTLPRSTAMLVSLDDIKLQYKAASASSNAVFTALQTVTAAMAQANEWMAKGPDTNSVTH
jgi:hypothetical protein